MHLPRLLGLAAASLLATTAVARAQPSLTAPAASPSTTTSTTTGVYLEPGVAVGVTWAAFYGAVQLDGGYRLGDGPIWLHGRLAQGAMGGIEADNMSSDFTEVRTGLEARGCVLDGIACLIGGVDLGYRHQMLATNYGRDTHNLAVAVARLGLDLGTKHVRLRPGVELSAEPAGLNGVGLTTGIAYIW